MERVNYEDDLTIGMRIREQRKMLGISLAETARRTGLTTSFLSQVERGLVSTSINSLRRISEALGVSILYFLNDSPRQDPVGRVGNRMKITLPGLSDIVYEVITTNLANKVEVFIGHLKPGRTYSARSLAVPTEECIYMISGQLMVGLENQDYYLDPGDSICFQGGMLKKFSCASDEEAIWVAVLTPPVF